MHHRRRKRACLALAAAALVVALAPPAQSSAVTFGTDLGRPATNPVACNDPGWFFYYTFNSCSFTSRDLSTGESGFPQSAAG